MVSSIIRLIQQPNGCFEQDEEDSWFEKDWELVFVGF
jgi:hypothetical protein